MIYFVYLVLLVIAQQTTSNSFNIDAAINSIHFYKIINLGNGKKCCDKKDFRGYVFCCFYEFIIVLEAHNTVLSVKNA